MNKSVMVGIPTRESVHPKVINSIPLDVVDEIRCDEGRPLYKARNNLIDYFLERDYEYLLFMDNDTILPQGIERVVYNEYEISAPLNWVFEADENQKRMRISYGVYRSEGADAHLLNIHSVAEDMRRRGEMLPVDAVGGGVYVVHRSVLENDDIRFAGMMEDFEFFREARKHGYRIMVDCSMRAGHLKSIDVRRLYEIGERAL